MKKVMLFASLLGSAISAQAMQCPPASAFSYLESTHQWVLNGSDKSQWWVAYSSANDESDKNSLSPIAELEVVLAGKDNNSYHGLCTYTHADVRIDLSSNEDFTVNPGTIPNFHPTHRGVDYKCITSASSTAVCQW